MTNLFEQILTKKLAIITESTANDVKNIHSGSYDRQAAEDILYKTIAPLTDSPRWVDSEWNNPTPPPEDYRPGGPAPQWTPEEVIFAFAGNPSKLFRGGSDSPSHGNRGGSPMWRAVMQVAKKFKKERDKSFIEDLYQNGMIPLIKLMKPGFDEGRSPFVSYVIRTVKGAIENGPGSSLEAQTVTSDDRATQQVGLKAAMKITDPNVIRQAAEVVQGKYQNEVSYDKNPGNPYGHYSYDFYKVMNNYADALEGGNPERIDDARQMMSQLVSKIDDVNEPIRGASSGLGQAISNKDRGAVSGDAIHLRTARTFITDIINMNDPKYRQYIQDKKVSDPKGHAKIIEKLKKHRQNFENGVRVTAKNLAALQASKPTEYGDKVRLENLKTYNDILTRVNAVVKNSTPETLKTAYDELSVEMKKQQDSKKFGVSSMDAKSGADGDGGDLKSTLPGSDGGGNDARELLMNSEAMNYALDIAINHDLNSILSKDSKYRAIAKAEAKGGEIGGKMTVNEFRYIIRTLGQSGSNYPGKGKMRANLTKQRDAVGWWQPGEDPEIEPIPGAEGIWNSIWKRGGYQSLGPTEISNEITAEVEEFNKLGIKTARTVKVDTDGEKSVAGKVAISNTIRSAKAKLKTILEIHKSDIGLDESSGNKLPFNLFTDKIDRQIVVETIEQMINKLDRVLLEDAPAGWKGTVEAMKKTGKFSTDPNSDKPNPYAIANAMKKKGYKSHYKVKENTTTAPTKPGTQPDVIPSKPKPSTNPFNPPKPEVLPQPKNFKKKVIEAYDDDVHPDTKAHWEKTHDHPIFDKYGKELSKSSFANSTAKSGINDISTRSINNVMMQTMRLYQQIVRIERNHGEQLEQLAKQIVSKIWGIPIEMLEADLGNPAPTQPDQEYDDDNEEVTIDDRLMKLINKRKTINSLTQGSAIHGMMTMHYVIDQAINNINPQLLQLYTQIAGLTHSTYWIVGLSQIAQSQSGGSVDIEYEPETNTPKIKARGAIFPVLCQELSKGVAELISHHSLSDIPANDLKTIYKNTDRNQSELFDSQVGPELWKKVLSVLPRGINISKFYTLANKLEPDELHDLLDNILSNPDRSKYLIEKSIRSSTDIFDDDEVNKLY